MVWPSALFLVVSLPSGIPDDVVRLADTSYAAREAAENRLVEAGEPALPAVRKAARDEDPERSGRAVAVLERWAFGTPATDAAFAEECERALDELADGEHAVSAALATAALKRHARERERRAVEALKALGAKPAYAPGGSSDSNRFGIGNFNQFGHLRRSDGQLLSEVELNEDWSGGEEGIWHLRRLRNSAPFNLNIRGWPDELSTDSINALPRFIPVKIDVSSAASLGVQADGSTPCRVSAVVPGGTAFVAGVRPQDVIVRLGDDPIKSLPHLKRVLQDYRPGQSVVIHVERAGRPLALPAKLQDWRAIRGFTIGR